MGSLDVGSLDKGGLDKGDLDKGSLLFSVNKGQKYIFMWQVTWNANLPNLIKKKIGAHP